MQYPNGHRVPAGLLIALAIGTAVSLTGQGCSTAPPPITNEATSPRATVYFEEVADWSFEAAHPATISPFKMKQVLEGIYLSETGFSDRSADGSKSMKAFSDEDVEYLAPLLARTLSQAKPEYVVAFRLSSSAGSDSEPTAGTLYVQNDLLYFTLISHYRGIVRREASLLESGRPARVVSFEPESVGHSEKAAPAIALGRRDLTALAIDYKRIGAYPDTMPGAMPPPIALKQDIKAPPPILVAGAEQSVSPDMPAAQDMKQTKNEELKEAQQALAQKDAKISSLRRDLESMRQQLEAKDKELRSVKAKQPLPKKEKRVTAEVVIK